MRRITLCALIVIFYIALGICLLEPFNSHPVTMFCGFVMGMITTVVTYEQQNLNGGE